MSQTLKRWLSVSSEYLVFWGSVILLGYTYLGYPALMCTKAAFRSRSPSPRGDIEPPVSVVIVAHNEAERITARLENLLALDYPRDRLEIVLASDGSTDATSERARAGGPTRPRAAPRGGKKRAARDRVARRDGRARRAALSGEAVTRREAHRVES